MDRLDAVLSEHERIGLDTSVFIYHFEAHPTYLPLTRRVLDAVSQGRLTAVTSVVTVMEIAVRPLQLRRPEVADEYEILLLHFPHLDVLDVTVSVARRAAELRAAHRLKPADALQVATCLDAGATLFVTNDRAVHAIPDLSVLLLADLQLGR